MISVDNLLAAANDHQVKVLRLLQPQGEPDIIECDGRLYVPDKECEFIPEEFIFDFDEQGSKQPVGKPSDDCERRGRSNVMVSYEDMVIWSDIVSDAIEVINEKGEKDD